MSDADQSTLAAEPNADVVNRFAQAVSDYSQAFQAAWMSPLVQEQGAEAYQRYTQALETLMAQDSYQQAVGAWKAYFQLIQDALAAEELQQPASEAYHTFVRALKHAWADTDPDAVNASTLAGISHSIASGILIAAAAGGLANMPSDTPADPTSLR